MAIKPSPRILPQNKQAKNQTAVEQEKQIEEVLSYPILLSDRVDEAVKEAESFKFECLEVGKKVGNLCRMLRVVVSLSGSTTTSVSFYDHPLTRIATEVSKNLEKSMALLKKCKRRSVLHRVITIVSTVDFCKLRRHLNSLIAYMKCTLSIFESGSVGGGIILTLR
ncbi:Hypothetical predicted protein [Olea europaea subsp. europaea]|uniref:DUF7792 domain-containing protein n=1 Tax=Olea europaea subsp. europaea TaxID=158383 RepID=A0A8S0PCV2_OLEEU|nr:Hypothetical predicted protein [Olea europaea subsp. europaea]